MLNNILRGIVLLAMTVYGFDERQLQIQAKMNGLAATKGLIPPSQDPWYTAPANLTSAQPGAVLRMRTAPGNLSGIYSNSSAAYQLLYRTTDSHYQPTFAVTTVFVPAKKWQTTSNNELLSYQIPYDSAFVDSSPSYTLAAGGQPDIQTALGLGWFVNVPDYETKLASFTAGVVSGHATLDSVRATLSQASTFGLRNPRAALWGYSGGALASEWAAELQNQYAPELIFVGAALGGLTPNITSVLFSVNGTVEAGLVPSGILGITSQYPEVRQYVVSQLKKTGPYNATRFLAAENYTLTQSIGAFANQDIGAYFINGVQALYNAQVVNITNRDGIMGTHGTPQMPLFVYKAIQDHVSVIADTDALVDRYCAVGANIWYQRNTIGGHSAEAANSDANAFEFLTGVFTGFYTIATNNYSCKIENVTVGTVTSTLV